MAKVTFNVHGMHCTSCELLIKDSLEDINRVRKVTVSHKKGTVEVEHDSADKAAIKKAIEAEGYKVS